MNRPSIDHTILSPSGRCSKRAREAALERERKRLFPEGYWKEDEKTEEQVRAERIESMLRAAQELRALAKRGMSPRKFVCEAERIEAEAERTMKGDS